MINKAIILAGGMGTRMSPLTKAVNKQLLPIYDKPLIFYPLSILMLAKIKDILIIVNKGQLNQYKKILPDGKRLGINIVYKEQKYPKGLPDAFLLGEKFINNKNVALILGDNFFYGQNLSKLLLTSTKLKKGAKVVLHKVIKPELFGVAKVNKNTDKSIILARDTASGTNNKVISGTGIYEYTSAEMKTATDNYYYTSYYDEPVGIGIESGTDLTVQETVYSLKASVTSNVTSNEPDPE